MNAVVERVARAIWIVRQKQCAKTYAHPHLQLEDWGDGSVPRANGIEAEATAAVVEIAAVLREAVAHNSRN